MLPFVPNPTLAPDTFYGLDLRALAQRPFAFLEVDELDDHDPFEGYGRLAFDPHTRTLTLEQFPTERRGTPQEVQQGLVYEWCYRRTLKGGALAYGLQRAHEWNLFERLADAFERTWDGRDYRGRLVGDQRFVLAMFEWLIVSPRAAGQNHQPVMWAVTYYIPADPDWLRAPNAPKLDTPEFDERVRREITEVRAAVSGAHPDAYFVTGIRDYCVRTRTMIEAAR